MGASSAKNRKEKWVDLRRNSGQGQALGRFGSRCASIDNVLADWLSRGDLDEVLRVVAACGLTPRELRGVGGLQDPKWRSGDSLAQPVGYRIRAKKLEGRGSVPKKGGVFTTVQKKKKIIPPPEGGGERPRQHPDTSQRLCERTIYRLCRYIGTT
jgi:hypothetical protein